MDKLIYAVAEVRRDACVSTVDSNKTANEMDKRIGSRILQ